MNEVSRFAFRMSPSLTFLVLICSIFISEVLIVLFIGIFPPLPRWGLSLLNAILPSVLTLPIIYFFIFRPLTDHITERNRIEEALRESEDHFCRMAEEISVIAEIGRVISSSLEIDEVYERFAAEARKLIPFDRITVNLCNIPENIITIAYVSGADLSNHKKGDTIPITGTLIEEVLRKRTGQIIQSEKIDEIASRVPGFSRNFQAGLRSLIGVPLIYKDEVIGVLQFRSKTPNAYTEQDLRLAERIGAQIAGAIANAKLFNDRKWAEEARRKSEAHLKNLYQESPIPTFTWQKKGDDFILIDFNRAAIQITDGKVGDNLGQSAMDLYKNRPQIINDMNLCLQERSAVKREITSRHFVPGRRLSVQYGFIPPDLIIVHTDDQTERKKAEELLRALSSRQEAILAAVPEIIMEVDNNKIYTWANSAGIEFFGEDVIGKEASFYFEGEQETYDKISSIFDGAEDIIYLESWQRRRDGEKRLLAWWCRVLTDEKGQVAGALSSARDITARKQAEEELRRNQDIAERLAREMAIIAKIGLVIGSTLNIDEVYERFAAETRKLIPIDSLTVNLYNLQENTLRVAYVSGLDIDGRRQGDPIILEGSLSKSVIRARAGIRIQPGSFDEIAGRFPRLSPVFQAGLRSMMCVPLVNRDEVIGVLHFRSKKPNAYTEQDLSLAERIGAQIAGAIANAQLYADIEKTENSLRRSEGRFRGLVEQAAVGVAEIEMSTGHFFTVNRRLCEMLGRTEEELMATTFLAITHPEDLHLHEGKTQMMLAGEIDHYSLEKRYLRKDGGIVWMNLTVSPLWKPGEAPGHNMIVVEDITERKRMEAEIITLSITDQLTGLYNRRGFMTIAEQQMRVAERTKKGMLVLYADLDDLKQINDKLGHKLGDEAIAETANILKEVFRKVDIIARMGGDEFAVLAPEASLIHEDILKNRLQDKLDAHNSRAGRDYYLSLSIGMLYHPPPPPNSLDDLISRSDSLMYEQKRRKKALKSPKTSKT